ncbi:MAG: glycosyltransferase [Rhodocyclaceae bacterium]|nr:MAG: glycosyltransferase [Rhodocyclaceae bacterium]TNC97589.1 MAG: glycosyltransferase [Rhodocyclaceae bacterium]
MSMAKPLRKVVVLQHRLLHYRVRFFQELRAACAERRIELCLVHGQPTAAEARKRDTGALDWADVVTNRYVNVRGRDVLWQPFPGRHRDAELVVMMQENRLLSNYPWLFSRNGTAARIGYWGHGRNFQTDAPAGLREKWKRLLVGRVDWWFAYTGMTRDILLTDGYPDERITVLDNAIDNEAFQADLASITASDLAGLRARVGAGETAPIGLFCGSLYPDKRIGFMIDAADRIRASIPDFGLVVIGDGPGADEVKAAAASRPWLHWTGALKGREKAAWFRLASVVMNPGLTGLHILDSFCAGVPLATTANSRHSPEIAYLESGVNGLVVIGGAGKYAQAIVRLLRDAQAFERLRQGALESARRYTLANMVEHFADGIVSCLAMERKS